MKKSILLWTSIYILIMLAISTILKNLNYQFLNWITYSSMAISFIGITTGTIQALMYLLRNHKALRVTLCIILVATECIIIGLSDIFLFIIFYNTEEIVMKNGTKMVKQTHSFLLSNEIKYYDYKNIFVKSRTVRIREAHNNYIGDYLYTTYFDENGKFIQEVDESRVGE